MKASSQNGSKARSNGSETDHRSNSDYLHLLGKSIRSARARRGMTRKTLAADSGVSERFLADLESGTGNASVLVLRQIAQSLNLPMDAILPRTPTQSDDLIQALELLHRLDSAAVARARKLLVEHFNERVQCARQQRIALIGLRGAGKSTIGKLLAKNSDLPFFELDRLVEQTSGLSLAVIFDLYGQSGFRRFERRCLDELLSGQQSFVLATGGSLVSEPATYDSLLSSCYTIWLRATPQEHMSRVIAQGDMRPMAEQPDAMAELERILAEREPLYRQADATVETSGKSIEEVLEECLNSVGQFRQSIAKTDSQNDRLRADRWPL
ncbi:MAG TPA: helix-turn-helix transcriptional regulator [Terriglobales bacterium]|nr:helix-turn-helix transcriptional regulator [Terriglobales bacterium]